MEAEEDIESFLETIQTEKGTDNFVKPAMNSTYSEIPTTPFANEIIDIEQIQFSDDETWLYKPEDFRKVTDLSAWLHEKSEVLKDLDFHTKHLSLIHEITKLDSTKKIDSRTFTRPKKRFNRPSLDFNESQFRIAEIIPNNGLDKDIHVTENLHNSQSSATTVPLHFNLSESCTNSTFSNVADGDSDLIQNMSPISLVNSSIFSSIIDNSYVKDDPVLRDITNADLSSTILQGCDTTIVKSATVTYDSGDSNCSDGFFNNTVEKEQKKFLKDNDQNKFNETYIANDTIIEKQSKNIESHLEQEDLVSREYISNTHKSSNLNETYSNKSIDNPNETFNIIMHNKNMNFKDPNGTFIIHEDVNIDSNKLNYTITHNTIEESKAELKYRTFLKRNSYSLGSSDSLDGGSSLSNSSSGIALSKMLNMAEVDAIVLQQEERLQQVMSTPKLSAQYFNTSLEHNISPIRQVGRPNNFSDSDGSSNDDYLTVDSGSTKSIASGSSDSVLAVQPKSLTNLKNNISTTRMQNIDGNKKISQLTKPAHYGSYTVLHRTKLMVQQNAQKDIASINAVPKPSLQTNLKSMNTNLKGSYTQLKPVFSNLPFTTVSNTKSLISNSNKTKDSGSFLKMTEVPLTVKDAPKSIASLTNTRAGPKASGLPRPVSAIPRPAASKIPGPLSMRSGLPQSRATGKPNSGTDITKNC